MVAPTSSKTSTGPIEGLGRTSGVSWWQRYKLPYLYILPAFVVLAIVTFYPIAYQVYLSFTNFAIKNLRTGNADWIGLRNYERIVKNQVPLPNFDFWNTLAFNFIWTISNVFFHVVIGVAVALLLNRRLIIGRRIWRAIFVIPWAMPPLVVATVWRNMFDTQFGAINQYSARPDCRNDIAWLTSTNRR